MMYDVVVCRVLIATPSWGRCFEKLGSRGGVLEFFASAVSKKMMPAENYGCFWVQDVGSGGGVLDFGGFRGKSGGGVLRTSEHPRCAVVVSSANMEGVWMLFIEC